MGHAQIHTTQKYRHALPDAEENPLRALNSILGRQILSFPAELSYWSWGGEGVDVDTFRSKVSLNL